MSRRRRRNLATRTDQENTAKNDPVNVSSSEEARDEVKRRLRIARDNPLGLILCGLAVGLVAGAIAPVTEMEREKLTPVREEFVEHAQQAVSDVMDHTKRVVEETVAAATDAATKHGQELASDLQQAFGIEQSAPDASEAETPT